MRHPRQLVGPRLLVRPRQLVAPRLLVALCLLGIVLLLALGACSGSAPPESIGPQPTPVHTDLEGAPPPRQTESPADTPVPTPEPGSTSAVSAAAPTPTSPATPGATAGPTPQPSPAPTPEPTRPPPSPGPMAVAEKPCSADTAEGWNCVKLTVPLDHFQDIGRSMDVTFALKRHTGVGPAKGTWVTITGGPGTAGIYSAVGYSDSFAVQIRRDYDLVFMDQRGSGQSGAFSCPNAALSLYTNPAGPTDPDGGVGLKSAARTFVDECLSESKVDESILPYLATRQAAEDLEAFRLWLGVDQLSLYGESYGTQYVQTYAAAHPAAVKILFVDGPVDLSLSGEAFYVEGARAYDNALAATLLDCTSQPVCSKDVSGGNALAAYDRLAAQLRAAPLAYTFTKANGTQVTRDFGLADLQNAAFAVTSESDRALLQRAVAAASRGDPWWLARFSYAQLGQDPETLGAVPDPSYADALYYAVECVDYSYFPDAGSPDQRADAYLAYGAEHGVNETRLAADFYGDLPCTYWPVQPSNAPRPLPAADADYPMVVLGATLDPSTPFQNAERIFARRTHATWLIYKPGGPHIIFGRGESCPDDLVTGILIHDRFPTEPTTVCPGDVADDYVPLIPRNLTDTTTFAAVSALDDEIVNGIDYQYWDAVDRLALGCPFGGSISYNPSNKGTELVLKKCAFMADAAATGRGKINDNTGGFQLQLTFSGAKTGDVSYLRDPTGKRTFTGRLARTATPAP